MKVGYYHSNTDLRPYLLYQKLGISEIEGIELSNGIGLSTIALGFAFVPRIVGDLRGNIGAYVGLSTLESEEKSTKKAVDTQGVAFGADVGILYDLHTFGEIELGLRYERASFELEFEFENRLNIKTKFELIPSHIGAFIGYNYKF